MKLAILFILAGFAGIGHHYYVCGRLFDWEWNQIFGLHHEPLILFCFAFAAGIVLLLSTIASVKINTGKSGE